MKQERNAKCACGSGRKYKKCCLLTERENARLAEIEWRARIAQRAEEKRLARELLIEQAKAKAEGHGVPAFVGNRRGTMSSAPAQRSKLLAKSLTLH